MHYDVFNGDADGIIALLQLNFDKTDSANSESKQASTLITGVKRDIELLKQVDSSKATSVTVLDISLEKNSQALNALLEAQVEVFYVDHHRTGDIPQSDKLTSILDTDANTCTSLLINKHLNGKYVYWAVAAAFGDNMFDSANHLAQTLNLTAQQTEQLKELGTYINYNGYGQSVSDLHFPPSDLYQALLKYPDPFELIGQENSIFSQLKSAYQSDMAKAQASKVLDDNEVVKTIALDDAPWARRVSGVFGNALANQAPDKAHIVVTLNSDNDVSSSDVSADVSNVAQTYTLSLRAPLNNKQGAGDICALFATGGGRAAAAGVNALPVSQLSNFIDKVKSYYQG